LERRQPKGDDKASDGELREAGWASSEGHTPGGRVKKDRKIKSKLKKADEMPISGGRLGGEIEGAARTTPLEKYGIQLT